MCIWHVQEVHLRGSAEVCWFVCLVCSYVASSSLVVSPALCVLASSLPVNSGVFKCTGRRGSPQFSQARHVCHREFLSEPRQLQRTSNAISSRDRMKASLIGPDSNIFTFYKHPSSKQLALLALERQFENRHIHINTWADWQSLSK